MFSGLKKTRLPVSWLKWGLSTSSVVCVTSRTFSEACSNASKVSISAMVCAFFRVRSLFRSKVS